MTDTDSGWLVEDDSAESQGDSDYAPSEDGVPVIDLTTQLTSGARLLLFVGHILFRCRLYCTVLPCASSLRPPRRAGGVH